MRWLILVAMMAADPTLLPGQDVLRPVDSTEVLVAPRPVDSIRADRERIGRLRGEADGRYDIARSRLAEVEIQLDLFDRAIDAVSARIKLAKNAKREADKTAAETERKDLERRKNLMERRRDLRQAEVDVAQAEGNYAALAAEALERELQLERKRSGSTDRAGHLELERKTLEAKLEQENGRKTLADRRARLVERQLSLLQGQLAFTKR